MNDFKVEDAIKEPGFPRMPKMLHSEPVINRGLEPGNAGGGGGMHDTGGGEEDH